MQHHETLIISHGDVGAQCVVSGNIGDCGVGITQQRVTNPWDTGIFFQTWKLNKIIIKKIK